MKPSDQQFLLQSDKYFKKSNRFFIRRLQVSRKIILASFLFKKVYAGEGKTIWDGKIMLRESKFEMNMAMIRTGCLLNTSNGKPTRPF